MIHLFLYSSQIIRLHFTDSFFQLFCFNSVCNFFFEQAKKNVKFCYFAASLDELWLYLYHFLYMICGCVCLFCPSPIYLNINFPYIIIIWRRKRMIFMCFCIYLFLHVPFDVQIHNGACLCVCVWGLGTLQLMANQEKSNFGLQTQRDPVTFR